MCLLSLPSEQEIRRQKDVPFVRALMITAQLAILAQLPHNM